MKFKHKDQEQEFSLLCVATGCPLRGSVSHDGHRYACSYHAFAESDIWPSVTSALCRNDRITLAITEVTKMNDADWQKGRWEMMSRFFSDEAALRPQNDEKTYRAWYEARLRQEMAFRAGAGSAPKVREKIEAAVLSKEVEGF